MSALFAIRVLLIAAGGSITWTGRSAVLYHECTMARGSAFRALGRRGGSLQVRRRWRSLGLVLASSVAGLALFEGTLRLLAPERFFVWPPGLEVTFTPDPAVLPGVSGDAGFRINSEGMRAGEPPREETYRILAVGGSTTECLFLDQEEAWPHLLERHLEAGRRRVFVGNVGMGGRASRDHRLQLEKLLPQHPDVRAVIALVGINDLEQRLQREVRPSGPFGPSDYRHAFTVVPGERLLPPEAPAWSRTRIAGLLRSLRAPAPPPDLLQDRAARFYVGLRARRAAAGRLRSLPDLSSALEEYRTNLEAMADIARRVGVRLVFMTQPVLWRAQLPESAEALLWFGRSVGAEYYDTSQLAQAMARYNDVVREVCARQGLQCVDLAQALPRSTSMFYDDCHFTERGARAAAAVVAEAFYSEGPLADAAQAARMRAVIGEETLER
jgi:lysophospholipase L1-like esterase